MKGLDNKYSLRVVDVNGARRTYTIRDCKNLLGLVKILSTSGTTSFNDFGVDIEEDLGEEWDALID